LNSDLKQIWTNIWVLKIYYFLSVPINGRPIFLLRVFL
jgi:hypothetical protein